MRDAAPGAKLDAVLNEPFAPERKEGFATDFAAEELAAERRPGVGATDFLADEEEIALVVERADCFGGFGAGDSAADEEIFYVQVTHGGWLNPLQDITRNRLQSSRTFYLPR
jgi:hypothetical protein